MEIEASVQLYCAMYFPEIAAGHLSYYLVLLFPVIK